MRFDELIGRGKTLPKPSVMQASSEDFARLRAWETACLHLVNLTFGDESVYYERLDDAFDESVESIVDRANTGVAILESAKEEIEKGFLFKIEHLLSVDLFDSILEQAEYLVNNGFKDVAAVLGRVVIEKSLKDIARSRGLEFSEKVKLAELNNMLWKSKAYEINVWRITQGHVDIGNLAAHGDFDKFNEQSVKDMLKWIRETLLRI